MPVEISIVGEDTEGVLSHFRAGEKFRRGFGEIELGLNLLAMDLDCHFEVRQEQAVPGTLGGTAGVQKPSGGTSGVGVQELQQLLLDVPEIPQGLLSDRERTQMHHRPEEGEIGRRITAPVSHWKFKSCLQSGKIQGGTVQGSGDIGKRVHGSNPKTPIVGDALSNTPPAAHRRA